MKRFVHYIIHDFYRRLRVMPRNCFLFRFKPRYATVAVMNNADNMVLSVNYTAEKAADYQK